MVRVLPIACVIAWAGSARGDGIGVVAASTSPDGRAAVGSALAGAAEPGRRVLADAVAEARAALADGAVPADTLQRFRRVHDLVDEGWRAYLRVSFDYAQARLAVARTEAEAIVALPGGAEVYADVALRLGVVLGQLGHVDDGNAALALALALDPERPITLAEFSPEVVAAVDAVRAQVRPTHTIEIASEPAGARASVDGKDVGATPVHVVIARAAGFHAAARTIAVDAATTDVRLDLERDAAAQRLADGALPGLADAAAQELADAALRFAELDEVVLAVATDRRGGEALLVQRCAGTPARCTAIVEIGYAGGGLAAAAREAWQAVRSADLRYPPSVLADPRVVAPAPPPHRCEVCRSPWLWGGVGVAAVATTIVIVAVATSSRPPPVVGVDPGAYVKP